MRCRLLVVCAVILFVPALVRADILFYPVQISDRTALVFRLQGKANAIGTRVQFRHPRFGRIYFDLNDVAYYKTKTPQERASEKLRLAESHQDVESCLEACHLALRNVLLDDYERAAKAAYDLAPDHPTVRRLVALHKKMGVALPASQELEQEMREYVPAGKTMEFARSEHFLLMHDTSSEEDEWLKKTRAQLCLELLETVYKCFLVKFALQGVEIQVPTERLKVVLFANKRDYENLTDMKSANLSKSSGFFSRDANTAVFFDQGTNEVFELMDKLNTSLQSQVDTYVRHPRPGGKEFIERAKVIQLLTNISKRNVDIEVISHEATHQLAANTGIMPNGAPMALWAAEGIATYFEAAKGADWDGIGAVNDERLKWYRGLESFIEYKKDKEREDWSVLQSIDFVTNDHWFRISPHIAYGQSWALTHFLMERHPKELVQYYLLMAQGRPEDKLSDEVFFALSFFPSLKFTQDMRTQVESLEAFEQVFGDSKEDLQYEWRSYMNSLKADRELDLQGVRRTGGFRYPQ